MWKQMFFWAVMTAMFLLLGCASSPEARPSTSNLAQGFEQDSDGLEAGDTSPSGPMETNAADADPTAGGDEVEADQGYGSDDEEGEYEEEGDGDMGEYEEEDDSWN